MGLFEQIISDENIRLAYKNTLKGKAKFKTAAVIFGQNETQNLQKLKQSLIDNTYFPNAYIYFKVYDPKERIIYAPKYVDKIVQHMLNNVLSDWYAKRFIYDSYACIKNKGNGRAVKRLHYFLRYAKWNYGPQVYITRVDISKFFYSIDRQILKNIIRRQITCLRTRNLIFSIIDSSPEDMGLPLGNLTSQLFANVYMNELDQYMKRNLGVKLYLRYADDIFIISQNKENARLILNSVREFVELKLNLKLHPYKSDVLPLDKGLDALGFKLFTTHIVLKRSTKISIKRRLSKMKKALQQGENSILLERRLNSWLSHVRSASVMNFINDLIAKYDFLYLNEKNILKIKSS